MDWRHWLHLIRNHTKEYRSSPDQALATVERAAGHDGNARAVLIAQQHDPRRRAPEALGGWLTRRFHWLWGALAGYGYRARRGRWHSSSHCWCRVRPGHPRRLHGA